MSYNLIVALVNNKVVAYTPPMAKPPRYSERFTIYAPDGTMERLRKVLRPREKPADVVRIGIAKEIEIREAGNMNVRATTRGA